MAKTLKKTVLKIGALEVPVALRTSSAASGEKVTIERRGVDADGSLHEVGRLDVIRGTRRAPKDFRHGVVRDGAFVELPREQIEHIAAQTDVESIDVAGFLEEDEAYGLMAMSARGAYWIAPQAGQPGRQTLRALHEAMGSAGRFAVARVALKKGTDPHLAIVWPAQGDGGLMVTLIAWAPERVEREDQAAADLAGDAPSPAVVAAAGRLIAAMPLSAEAVDAMRSERQEQIARLVERVLAGGTVEAPSPAPVGPAEEAALIAALEESLVERGVGVPS